MPEYESVNYTEDKEITQLQRELYSLLSNENWYDDRKSRIIATTVVDCSKFLNVPIPKVSLKNESDPDFKLNMAKGILIPMQLAYQKLSDKQANPEYGNFELSIAPTYLENVFSEQGTEEDTRKFTEDHLMFNIAHEVYHQYQLQRFPSSLDRYVSADNFDTSSQYNSQRMEYGANLFALSYIRSKLFEDWRQVLSRFLFITNRVNKIKDSQRAIA